MINGVTPLRNEKGQSSSNGINSTNAAKGTISYHLNLDILLCDTFLILKNYMVSKNLHIIHSFYSKKKIQAISISTITLL